jgi:UbiD family decarboxylase
MASRKYYRDFREHLKALEDREKLIRIRRRIDKDTELMPLVRWQFRGLDEQQRKSFLFENVVDAKGKQYSMPVTVGTLAATTEIYAIGLMCRPEEIHERWTQAQLSPIEPVKVVAGPVQEMVWTDKELLNGHGLDMLPVPISTPGFDNAPYLTSANWISKDMKAAFTTSAIIVVKSNLRIALADYSPRNTWGNTGASVRLRVCRCRQRSPSVLFLVSPMPRPQRLPTISTSIDLPAAWPVKQWK